MSENYSTPIQTPKKLVQKPKKVMRSDDGSSDNDSMEVDPSIGIPQSALDQNEIESFRNEYHVAKTNNTQNIYESGSHSEMDSECNKSLVSSTDNHIDDNRTNKIDEDNDHIADTGSEDEDDESIANSDGKDFGQLSCSTCNGEFSSLDVNACSGLDGNSKCSSCYLKFLKDMEDEDLIDMSSATKLKKVQNQVNEDEER